MESVAELLENELKAALDVKNEQSLHNYVTILTENILGRKEYMYDNQPIRNDIKATLDAMHEGFRRMDARFEVVDARFEAMEKRFEERFEAMDRRFGDRFEAMDRRFGDRFEAVDRRFEDLIGQMNSRFRMMFAFTSGGIVLITLLMTLYQFFG